MLTTILKSQTSPDGMRVVVRTQDEKTIDTQARFMTHMVNERGDYFGGNYDMYLSDAHVDYLARCKANQCPIFNDSEYQRTELGFRAHSERVAEHIIGKR